MGEDLITYDGQVNCAAVIPCLNEAEHIGSVVGDVLPLLLKVIVVDDGSKDGTSQEAARAGAEVIRHEANQGKGAAVQRGLGHARECGFEWALLLDGDGQHAASDIPKFLSETGAHLVIGNRMAEAGQMPWLRRFVNRWMSRQLSCRLGMALPDTQCGFRLVHLPSWSQLNLETSHFEIESEMLTAFVEAGLIVKFVPVRVVYRNETSKIDPILDTVRWFRWWSHAS
ncbi:MAG TPA: glycosyltransferase family 2 protein [Verrucomicrobiae bacterium]|nr:glycosyltransferase family 2 protein [Verrucomicrobiae bacterium]